MNDNNKVPIFDTLSFPGSSVIKRTSVDYRRKATIFSQGDPSSNVSYIERGGVRLSIVTKSGREAVIGILRQGDFVGQACLSGLPFRMVTATAIMRTTLLVIDKNEMIRALHNEKAFSGLFIFYMLSRNIRVEEDLIDQLFNSSEKRLARTLLLLARHGRPGHHQEALPKISQEVLAEMVGTTRSRVNIFMNKFRKLGFIDYRDTIRIHNSLLNVILPDEPAKGSAMSPPTE